MTDITENDKKIARFGLMMFYLGVVFLGIAFIIIVFSTILSPANAQEYNTEYDNCEIRQFRENAYTPFRIAMTHEPALRQTVTQSHNDPASRLVFEQFEQETDEAKTFLAFSTNSTDDWIIRVDLEYKSQQSDIPRTVLIDYDSNNLNLAEERIYHEGYNFCIVYLINARPPPKIPTADEILGLADKIQQENFEVVANQIADQTQSVIRGTDVNTVFTMLLLVMIIVIISAGVSNRRATKKLKTELAHERTLIVDEREKSELARQNVDHHMDKFDNFIKQAEIEMNSIMLDARKIEGVFDKKKDDVYDKKDFEKDMDLASKPTATLIIDETKPESTTEKIAKGIKGITDSLTKKEQPPPKDPELDKQKEHFKKTLKTRDELLEKYTHYHNKYRESPSDLIAIQVNALYELIKEWTD